MTLQGLLCPVNTLIMNNKFYYFLASLCLLFSACQKDSKLPVDSEKTGQLKLKFDHIVGARVLNLNSVTYSNSFGENYSIDTLNYDISNIRLGKEDGSSFELPKEQSHFHINISDAESQFPTFQVPEGTYTKLTFTIGLASQAASFFQFSGQSTASPTGKYQYLVGSNTAASVKTIELDLKPGGAAQVQAELSADIHLMIDLAQIFDGPQKISIKEHPTVVSGDFTKVIANNYQGMFRHDHTHNFQKLNGGSH